MNHVLAQKVYLSSCSLIEPQRSSCFMKGSGSCLEIGGRYMESGDPPRGADQRTWWRRHILPHSAHPLLVHNYPLPRMLLPLQLQLYIARISLGGISQN